MLRHRWHGIFLVLVLALGTFVLLLFGSGVAKLGFDEGAFRENWPSSGKEYAFKHVQTQLYLSGCKNAAVESHSKADELNWFERDTNCQQSVSLKKWLVEPGYLVGIFQCQIANDDTGGSQGISAEVSKVVYRNVDHNDPIQRQDASLPTRGPCFVAYGSKQEVHENMLTASVLTETGWGQQVGSLSD